MALLGRVSAEAVGEDAAQLGAGLVGDRAVEVDADHRVAGAGDRRGPDRRSPLVAGDDEDRCRPTEPRRSGGD